MQTYTSKKEKKNNTEGIPGGCRSVPVSVCVMQCQRDKQNLHHCAAGTPSKTVQFPFNSSTQHFWQEPNSLLMHFKVKPLQTNRFLASMGFGILGLWKPVLDLMCRSAVTLHNNETIFAPCGQQLNPQPPPNPPVTRPADHHISCT